MKLEKKLTNVGGNKALIFTKDLLAYLFSVERTTTNFDDIEFYISWEDNENVRGERSITIRQSRTISTTNNEVLNDGPE